MAVVKDTDRGRLLTRRAFVLAGLQAGLFVALFARLYGLQVKQGERFQTLAEENRVSMRLIVPPRGIISDRNGMILAHSRKSFRADLIPEQSQNTRETLRRLYQLMPFADWEKKRIAKDIKIKKSRSFVPLLLRDNLDWEQMALLELNTPDLPGVVIEAGETRYYPLAEAASHVLGYIGIPNEEEAKKDPVLDQPGFRVGKNGLERFYDKQLRGEAGTVQMEVNAYGRPVRELDRMEGAPGREIRLSLDAELQRFTQNRLAGVESAAAVVMDAINGQVYALVSHPSFDANAFTLGISKEIWAKLTSDPKVPLLNKAVLGLYAPGSTFKVVTALAALQAGVSPKTAIFCPGHLDFGTHRFHCWKKGGHGTVDMKRGIVQSCDVFFYHMGQRIGIDAIHTTAVKLGLATKTGLDLPHEKLGVIPNTEWKKNNFKESWQGGETLVAAIGQGYMLASPLQLAVMTARIANGGRAVTPRLMSGIKGEETVPRVFEDIGIKREHLAFVRDAMLGVCQKGGTASASQIPVEGFEMAGKTGTSQVRRISKSERATGVIANEDRPWEERDHALFIAYVPASAPRYAVAVIVEHGGGGSKAAAPIARDILMETLKHDPAKILPVPFVPPIIKPPEEKPKAANEQDDEEAIEEIQEMLEENPQH